MKHYGPQHYDYDSCLEAKQKLAPIVKKLPAELKHSVSYNHRSKRLCDIEN